MANAGHSAPSDPRPPVIPREDARWAPFVAISAAYLAVTVGESMLAPLYPVAAEDLGLDLSGAGAALGLLTGSIAIANIAGGYVLARRGPKAPILLSQALAVSGAVLAAVATSVWPFLAAQVLLGLAAGTFFAPGINAVGTLAGSRRRGMFMGVFGIAFSAGLTLAALLGAAGAAGSWRMAFAVAALFAVGGGITVAIADLPGARPEPEEGARRRLRDAIGTATAVGSAAAVSQYGTVAFFPAFAVSRWGLDAGAAALVLAAGRVASVPGKALSGHASDRRGPLAIAGWLGAVLVPLGLAWMLAPSAWWGVVPAVAFVAAVGSLFPVANLLAYGTLGNRGPLLGTFRSVQMGAGAVAAAGIGAGAETVGLRPTLLITLVAPLGLAFTHRRSGAGAA